MPQLTEIDESATAPMDEPTIQDGSGSDSDGSLPGLEAGEEKAGASTDVADASAAPESPSMESKVRQSL